MHELIWLVSLGFFTGVFGTLVGAGGGFVLVPVLLLIYPGENPETITSISLAVVFFNALSGSLAYARMGRIDYKTGLWLAAATVPGAILGALTTEVIPRRVFNVVFGLMLTSVAFYLAYNQTVKRNVATKARTGSFVRNHVEKDGTAHQFSFDLKLGMALSFAIGYVSSLLGIGGGIIHVPMMVCLLDFPVHIATATSHFVLAIMALIGTITHVVTGSFTDGFYSTVAISAGVVVGAQAGAVLSNKLRGKWIMIGLALALAFAGIRIFVMAM
jgi:hypothetical protein